MGKRTSSAPDVERAFTGSDAVDEEIVVLHQAMLGVNAVVIFDREPVDPPVEIVVDLNQCPKCISRPCLRSHPVRPAFDETADDCSGYDLHGERDTRGDRSLPRNAHGMRGTSLGERKSAL